MCKLYIYQIFWHRTRPDPTYPRRRILWPNPTRRDSWVDPPTRVQLCLYMPLTLDRPFQLLYFDIERMRVLAGMCFCLQSVKRWIVSLCYCWNFAEESCSSDIQIASWWRRAVMTLYTRTTWLTSPLHTRSVSVVSVVNYLSTVIIFEH